MGVLSSMDSDMVSAAMDELKSLIRSSGSPVEAAHKFYLQHKDEGWDLDRLIALLNRIGWKGGPS